MELLKPPEILVTEAPSSQEYSPPPIPRLGTLSRGVNVFTPLWAFFEVSDNRMAMKLFGNRRALDKEKERQKKAARFVIHPCSKFRFYWDLVMVALLLANLVIMPLSLTFYSEDFMEFNPGLIFNCISDALFIIDICINFRTGIVAKEPGADIILNPRKIAVKYVKTWFFVDLISSIPFDYIFLLVIFLDGQEISVPSLLHAGRAFRFVRLAKVFGLLKLLRVSRLVRYIQEWQEFLNVAAMVFRIINLIGFAFLIAHWNGCLQFMVPMLQGFPEGSWVYKRMNFTPNATVFDQYSMSLFRALSHMLSIGYGQDIPELPSEIWMTLLSMIVGATCHAVFIGHMTNLIHSYDSSRRMYSEKQKQLQEYFFARKLPRELCERITDYYEHRFQGKIFDEATILTEISDSLRENIVMFNCKNLIARVPLFANAEPSFLQDILTKLRTEMYQPNDWIIKEGTIGKKMFFIQDGSVDIVKHNEIHTTLTEGSYFGEICLLAHTKRCASVRAVTYCQLFSLQKDDFEEVMETYPMMKSTMKGIAAQRLYKIGENPRLVSKGEELQQDLTMAREVMEKPAMRIRRFTKPSLSSENLSAIAASAAEKIGGMHMNNRNHDDHSSSEDICAPETEILFVAHSEK